MKQHTNNYHIQNSIMITSKEYTIFTKKVTCISKVKKYITKLQIKIPFKLQHVIMHMYSPA